VQPKMSLNSREFLIWKEREGGHERERGGWVGQQAGVFKVRFGQKREIEGRYKEIERHRNKETWRQS
jgi:hypothetical protein